MLHYDNDYIRNNTAGLVVGQHIHIYTKLPSTMQLAHTLILQEAATEGAVVLAQCQTAGRGRFNREWISPAGNMWISVILYPKPDMLPWLFAICGLAVKNTLEQFGLKAFIKWPNDVLVNNLKIAGILIEGTANKKCSKVVCGIGLNVNLQAKQVKKINQLATSMSEQLGRQVDVNEVLVAFLKELNALYINADINSIYAKWKEAMGFLGTRVSVLGNDGERINGIATDIDKSGRLLVLDESGRKYAVSNGDLSVN